MDSLCSAAPEDACLSNEAAAELGVNSLLNLHVSFFQLRFFAWFFLSVVNVSDFSKSGFIPFQKILINIDMPKANYVFFFLIILQESMLLYPVPGSSRLNSGPDFLAACRCDSQTLDSTRNFPAASRMDFGHREDQDSCYCKSVTLEPGKNVPVQSRLDFVISWLNLHVSFFSNDFFAEIQDDDDDMK